MAAEPERNIRQQRDSKSSFIRIEDFYFLAALSCLYVSFLGRNLHTTYNLLVVQNKDKIVLKINLKSASLQNKRQTT